MYQRAAGTRANPPWVNTGRQSRKRSSGTGLRGVSLPVKLAGFYFFLIFVIWPFVVYKYPGGGAILRFPLLVGMGMMGLAVLRGVAMKRIRLAAQLFFIFAFFFVISSVYGPRPPGLAEGVTQLFRSVGLGAVLVMTIRTVTDLHFFLRVFVWAGVIDAIYGLLFMIPGLSVVGFKLFGMGFPMGRDLIAFRMNGIQSDPTYFGLFVMPAFLISLNEVLRKRKESGWLSLSITALLFLSIILSFSRTTWAGTAAGILVLAGLRGHFIRIGFIFVALVVFLQIAAPDDFLAAAISQNSARTSLVLENQADSRTWIWKAYLELAMTTPWGYGMGSIEELRQFATWSMERSGSTARPHNIYLILWVENGLQTLLPFLSLVGLGMLRAWKMRDFGDPTTQMEYGTLSLALISSMTVGLFALGGMIQLLSIVVAIGLATWYLKVDRKLVQVG
ncbi:MAG: O-antigen ligase family protein [Magnetococcales bacterium]|nr:O-antigen ligase family protein [Magnetococcales bacterium]